MIPLSNPSRHYSVLGLASALAMGVLASASVANAQPSFAILHSFTGSPTDGRNPIALIQGPDGTLYGTTEAGGTSNLGTIFQMAPDGSSYMVLHSFAGADGNAPFAGLVQDPDGTLYGTTAGGGTNGLGTVFQITPDGSGFTVMHNFTGGVTDGAGPSAGLVQDPDGTLYGTTYSGGTSNLGTVFHMAPDGSGYAVLHSFTGGGTDGAKPNAGLIQGPDGTLYGTTTYGGSSGCIPLGCGTVFQIAPDGSGYDILHSFTRFPTDGFGPSAALIQGPDGTLYGTTLGGGTNVRGTVFQMEPDGSGFTVLHNFTGGPGDGANPLSGLIQGSDGTLYGTTGGMSTSNLGTVFQMAPDGSGFTVMHNFTGGVTDGAYPSAGLIQGPDGTLYGTTPNGGIGGTFGNGVVFQLTLSPSAPTSTSVGHK